MAGKGTIINIPKPSPLQLADAYKMFIDAYKENQQVAEIEKTKRVAIEAHKEVELQSIMPPQIHTTKKQILIPR